jgi:hypothetical protein
VQLARARFFNLEFGFHLHAQQLQRVPKAAANANGAGRQLADGSHH